MFLSLQGVLFATLMYHAKVGLSFCFQIGYGISMAYSIIAAKPKAFLVLTVLLANVAP